MRFSIVALLCTLLLGGFSSSGFADEPKPDYQKLAEQGRFLWSKAKASAFYSLMNSDGEDEIQVVRNPHEPIQWDRIFIRFVGKDKTVFSIEGHENTVFKALGNVVYYADYSNGSNGCEVVAYDLKQKKQVWRTQLQGVGWVMHSAYYNFVNLNASSEAIEIYGHEAFGDYLEYLDPKSGKTVGHKIFRKDYAPFLEQNAPKR